MLLDKRQQFILEVLVINRIFSFHIVIHEVCDFHAHQAEYHIAGLDQVLTGSVFTQPIFNCVSLSLGHIDVLYDENLVFFDSFEACHVTYDYLDKSFVDSLLILVREHWKLLVTVHFIHSFLFILLFFSKGIKILLLACLKFSHFCLKTRSSQSLLADKVSILVIADESQV